MTNRARWLSAAVVFLVGLFALRRATESEPQVPPGTWDPVP